MKNLLIVVLVMCFLTANVSARELVGKIDPDKTGIHLVERSAISSFELHSIGDFSGRGDISILRDNFEESSDYSNMMSFFERAEQEDPDISNCNEDWVGVTRDGSQGTMYYHIVNCDNDVQLSVALDLNLSTHPVDASNIKDVCHNQDYRSDQQNDEDLEFVLEEGRFEISKKYPKASPRPFQVFKCLRFGRAKDLPSVGIGVKKQKH